MPRGAWRPSPYDQQRHIVAPVPLQELAAALELQRERAARGGGGTAGPAGSDEEGEDGEGGEQGGAQPAQRPAIYNVDAIHDKLEDIGWVLGGPPVRRVLAFRRTLLCLGPPTGDCCATAALPSCCAV